jgi:hypothetical protein
MAMIATSIVPGQRARMFAAGADQPALPEPEQDIDEECRPPGEQDQHQPVHQHHGPVHLGRLGGCGKWKPQPVAQLSLTSARCIDRRPADRRYVAISDAGATHHADEEDQDASEDQERNAEKHEYTSVDALSHQRISR